MEQKYKHQVYGFILGPYDPTGLFKQVQKELYLAVGERWPYSSGVTAFS